MFWLCSLGGFVVGAIAAKTAKSGAGQTVLKSIIRAGYAATESIRTGIAEVREDLSDIAAEAKYESEKERGPHSV